MSLSRWNSLAALALAGAGLGGLSAAAQDETAPAAKSVEIEIVAQAAEGETKYVPVELLRMKERGQQLVVEGAEETAPYWIGVQLEPPTDILKEHLKLAGGMVVVHVYEGSPAAMAGLKTNDILLKAADMHIKESGDLLTLVGKSPEKELTLVLLRGGQETTLKVVPAKRPSPAALQLHAAQAELNEAALKEWEAVIDATKLREGIELEHGVDVLRVRPGVVTSRVRQLGLPQNVTVTITKEGGAPAKIIVKKDGKEYEATEDKLEKLPEDVRGYVQIVRGGEDKVFAFTRGMADLSSRVTPQTAKAYRATAVATVPAHDSERKDIKVFRYQDVPKHAAGNVDSKLDQILKIVSQKGDSGVSELRKEVQQLRKELEELRQEKK
jgi:PDZ domain